MTCRNAGGDGATHSGHYSPVGPRKHAYGRVRPRAEPRRAARASASTPSTSTIAATSTADVAGGVIARIGKPGGGARRAASGCAAGAARRRDFALAVERCLLPRQGRDVEFCGAPRRRRRLRRSAALEAAPAGDLVVVLVASAALVRDASALRSRSRARRDGSDLQAAAAPAVHADTFDNLHVVISGEKRERVSPRFAREMYVDFPPLARPDATGDDEIEAPPQGGVGCAFVRGARSPSACPRRRPRRPDIAARARRERRARAVVRATDTLFSPALWFHRILHHPRVERADARSIALTFTRQLADARGGLPFAAGRRAAGATAGCRRARRRRARSEARASRTCANRGTWRRRAAAAARRPAMRTRGRGRWAAREPRAQAVVVEALAAVAGAERERALGVEVLARQARRARRGDGARPRLMRSGAVGARSRWAPNGCAAARAPAPNAATSALRPAPRTRLAARARCCRASRELEVSAGRQPVRRGCFSRVDGARRRSTEVVEQRRRLRPSRSRVAVRRLGGVARAATSTASSPASAPP